jgi:hypothetical protein
MARAVEGKRYRGHDEIRRYRSGRAGDERTRVRRPLVGPGRDTTLQHADYASPRGLPGPARRSVVIAIGQDIPDGLDLIDVAAEVGNGDSPAGRDRREGLLGDVERRVSSGFTRGGREVHAVAAVRASPVPGDRVRARLGGGEHQVPRVQISGSTVVVAVGCHATRLARVGSTPAKAER